MIVAACAGDGEAHCASGGDIDPISDDEVVLPPLIGAANGQKSQGGEFLTWKVH